MTDLQESVFGTVIAYRVVTIEYSQLKIRIMEKNQQVIENAVEIAMNNLRELQNTVDMGRDRLISEFIIKWAEEAEPEYQRVVKENGGEYPYYDFIDEFSEKKMVEVRELCRKGLLPTVPSANTAREDFNMELFKAVAPVFMERAGRQEEELAKSGIDVKNATDINGDDIPTFYAKKAVEWTNSFLEVWADRMA